MPDENVAAQPVETVKPIKLPSGEIGVEITRQRIETVSVKELERQNTGYAKAMTELQAMIDANNARIAVADEKV